MSFVANGIIAKLVNLCCGTEERGGGKRERERERPEHANTVRLTFFVTSMLNHF